MSEYFTMENGVKLGRGYFPYIFSIYIDLLLLQLRNSGYGCHLNGVYMGALSYADDIRHITPSIGGLNEMLKFVIIMLLYIMLFLIVRKLSVLNLVMK